MIKIAEKTFLITGAGTGIGYSIADRLITPGAKVILHCNSHIESTQQIRNESDDEVNFLIFSSPEYFSDKCTEGEDY
jgi:NAD(P)-dependent dehydrogenase (short-subunit alcohol dehydrogenase family)